jgi:CBS domain-containing protein
VGSILYDLFYFKEAKTPAAPYKVEGVGEDMLPDNVHLNIIDDFVQVSDKESFTLVREIVAKEGICVGPSCALALAGAIKYSEKFTTPMTFLVIMPDSGRAYMSKAFNDDWMKDNDFLPSPMRTNTVRDMLGKMTQPDLISVKVGQTVMEVVSLLKDNNISQVPVYSDGQIVGILDESDLIFPLATGKLKPTEPIIHLIKGNIIWVELEDNLEHLSTHFQKGFIALVKDPAQKTRLITKIDLLDYMSHFLT